MRRASEPIRRLCLGFLLALAPAVSALPANVPARHAFGRRHAAVSAKHVPSRRIAHRSRSRRLSRPSYVLASARIPIRHFAAVSTGSPLPAFPPQDEQRIPRQAPRKTAALQGIVRDAATRGIVGALIALTNRATGMTRTITTNADGVFRWTDLAPGTYLLLVQSDGFESLTRDDLRLDAGDVVTVELTLAPSPISAAPASRLPRMPELGPPAPRRHSHGGYRALSRDCAAVQTQSPDRKSSRRRCFRPSQEVFLAMPDRWNVAMPEWNRYGRSGEYPYVRTSHWWDPFNRNRLKGDEPIFGQQTFLNITATSDTSARRAPRAVDEQHQLGAARQQRFFRQGRAVRAERNIPLFLRSVSRRHFVPSGRLANPRDARRERELFECARAGHRERRRARRHDAPRCARRPSGSVCGIQDSRFEPELRFPFRARGNSGIFQRFSRIYFRRRAARRARVRKSSLRPLGIQRRLFQPARKKHEQRAQHVRAAPPAGDHREFLHAGFHQARLHDRVQHSLQQGRRRAFITTTMDFWCGPRPSAFFSRTKFAPPIWAGPATAISARST